MRNFMNVNKGITLLALIITIIVMLILAGVTLSMIVGEDGVIARTEYAKEEQRGATVEEHRDLWKSSLNTDALVNTSSAQSLEELLDDLKEGKLINQKEKEFIIDNGYIEIGSRTIEFTDIPPEIKIGDFVNYTYDEIENYLLEGKYAGWGNNQLIDQVKNMNWRVLNINNNGYLEIISKEKGSESFYLLGSTGYCNAVFLLNDMCKYFYGNKNLGTVARNLNLEDIEKQYNEIGMINRNNYLINGVQYNGTKEYTKEGIGYPEIYELEKGAIIDGKINENLILQSDSIFANKDDLYERKNLDSNYKIIDESISLTQTFYTYTYKKENFKDSNFYFVLDGQMAEGPKAALATRVVSCEETGKFGIIDLNRATCGGLELNFRELVSTETFNSNFFFYLRPVVSIDLNKIKMIKDEATGNWNLIKK